MNEWDELVSKQTVIDEINKWLKNFLEDRRDLPDVIKELPPVKLKIIRCKDCKYCVYTPATPNANRQSEGHNPERWNCYLYLHEHHPAVTPNDFCSKAERRTDVWKEVKK